MWHVCWHTSHINAYRVNVGSVLRELRPNRPTYPQDCTMFFIWLNNVNKLKYKVLPLYVWAYAVSVALRGIFLPETFCNSLVNNSCS